MNILLLDYRRQVHSELPDLCAPLSARCLAVRVLLLLLKVWPPQLLLLDTDHTAVLLSSSIAVQLLLLCILIQVLLLATVSVFDWTRTWP